MSTLEMPEFDPVLDRYIEDIEGLGNGPLNRLHSARIYTVRDLSYVSKSDILKIRNCGVVTAQKIFDWAEVHNISISEKYKDLKECYDFSAGDKIMMRLDVNKNFHKVWGFNFTRGDIGTIADDFQSLRFCLNQYTVRTIDGRRFWVTPGMIVNLKDFK